MKTNKKGISLIVLVITIIVMIILSAAIIISLTSNDIIDSAKEATNASDLANAKQVVMVAESEWEIEPEKGKTFKQYAEEKLIEAGFSVNGGTGSLEVTKDADVYVYPTIPNGFVASKAEGESKVSEGLVIYETTTEVNDGNVDTARTSYNQYVWVPVEDITTFERVEWGKGITISLTKSYNVDVATEAIEYNAMKASVEKYGGFYIARYEAGKGQNDTVISRKEATAWNDINWEESKTKASTLSTDSVVSHLIYGEEWDAALNFISKTDPTYPTEFNAEKGNYSSNSYISGSNEAYAANNIYDMSGNLEEWTMEMRSATSRITRGGRVTRTVGNNPSYQPTPSHRFNDNITGSNNLAKGFRLSLYMK